jgi:hypothetical protein
MVFGAKKSHLLPKSVPAKKLTMTSHKSEDLHVERTEHSKGKISLAPLSPDICIYKIRQNLVQIPIACSEIQKSANRCPSGKIA